MSINYLELIDDMPFPATRAEIIDWVQTHEGSEEAVEAFRAMPRQYFNSVDEVTVALSLIGRLAGEDSGSLPSMRD